MITAFLLLHDQVVGALSTVAVRLIVLGGICPTSSLVNRKVAVVNNFCGMRKVEFLKQCVVVRHCCCTPILLFKDACVFAFNGIPLTVIGTVFRYFVDEEERENLDAVGAAASPYRDAHGLCGESFRAEQPDIAPGLPTRRYCSPPGTRS